MLECRVSFCNEGVEYENEIFNAYLKKLAKTPVLTPSEELKLAKKVAEGDKEAKKQLVQANLRLVVSIARKIKNNKISTFDLVQEGNVGLITAVEKFNYKLGYKFSTYATWWIKQAMLKLISEQSHCMKVPVYVQETVAKYSKIKAGIANLGNCEEKPVEITHSMSESDKKICDFMNAFPVAVSIDASYENGKGQETSLADMLADKNINITADIEFEHLKRDIINALNKLKPRENEVIQMRFGMKDSQKRTLEDIGNVFGVTKECVRQTEIRAINKLKELFYNDNMLECYL